jgi:predicted RNA binding protein YcfA (HicA-like mRNA interferase family)
MAVLDAKKTYKNLLKKGFADAKNKSIDHKYLELFDNGRLILHTKISHGETDLGHYLIKQMSLQCKLEKNEFMDLANCPMSKNVYFDILKAKGYIETK